MLAISGFSLSMCDVDYFMSRLARRLCQLGFPVLQLDPRGHGDSGGNLEDVTLSQLRGDLTEGLRFLRNRYGENVYIAGRGLSASISADLVYQGVAEGAVGVCPYCLQGSVVRDLWGELDRKSYTGIELVPGKEYRTLDDFDKRKVAFFGALGARLRNLLGQKISSQFLRELMEFDPLRAMVKSENKTCWLFYDDESENHIKRWEAAKQDSYIDLQEYALRPFLRDPIWMSDIMKAAGDWLLSR